MEGFSIISGVGVVAEKVHFSQEEEGICVLIMCGCLEGVDCLGERFRELAWRWAIWGRTVHKEEGKDFFGIVEGIGEDAIVLVSPREVVDFGLKGPEELKGLSYFGGSWSRSVCGWQIGEIY